MTRIVKELKENQREHPVRLVTDGDMICAHCPNLLEGCCSSFEKVNRYDQNVLKMCGLEKGQCLTYDQFHQLVQEKILVRGRLEEICGDCEWVTICRKKAERQIHK